MRINWGRSRLLRRALHVLAGMTLALSLKSVAGMTLALALQSVAGMTLALSLKSVSGMTPTYLCHPGQGSASCRSSRDLINLVTWNA
jgi:hypothetical protein